MDDETSQERSTNMSMADETTQFYHNLENTVVELNDYISETDRKMIASANVFMEGIEELEKNREESIKLFNELMINMRDIGQERNLLEVRKKIDYVNQWLEERTVVIDETITKEHTATGFDRSAATRRSRKRQKLGHEPLAGSSQSSTARGKFSVLLVDYDLLARIHNMMQIIQIERKNNLGMEVQVAKDGQQAIRLHRQGLSFDLILMDMDMPDSVTSGYEATTRLRSFLSVKKSNIIGVSNKSVSKEINEFIRAGHLNGCIGKPLNAEKIASFLPIQKSITDPQQEDKGLVDP